MRRRTRSLLLVAGTLTSLVVAVQPASAADPVLTVSATSGVAGDLIAISGTECTSTDDAERLIRTKFIVGTAPDETFAGFAEGFDGEVGTLEIPAWVAPTTDAVLEAECIEFDFETGETSVVFAYDPVPFEVLASMADPQVATFSRTTVKVGQVIGIDLTGCDIDLDDVDEDGPYADLLVFAGDDLSGRDFSDPEFGFGGGLSSDGATLTVYFDATDQGDGGPNPGSYVVVPVCFEGDHAFTYEPQVVVVEANPATAAIDLVITPETSLVTLSGAECFESEVQVSLIAIPDDLFEGPDFDAATGANRAARPSWSDPAGRTETGWNVGRARVARAVEDEIPFFDATVTPAADGTWSVEWDAEVDGAEVLAFARCGDAEGDGFIYRTLDGRIDVPPPPAPPVPPAPPAPPANALPGTPTYAG